MKSKLSVALARDMARCEGKSAADIVGLSHRTTGTQANRCQKRKPRY